MTWASMPRALSHRASQKQLQQRVLIGIELLQGLALDARHDAGDEPTLLAHLDHGD